MDREFSVVLICPHCSGEIRTRVALSAEAMSVDQKPKHTLPRGERFSSYEVALLNQADDTGLLAAFMSAVKTAKGTQTPKDMDKFFLNYVRTCIAVKVPQATLTVLISEYPQAEIKVYATQGIVMVTADGRPVLFAPEVYARISGERAKSAMPLDVTNTSGLVEWIRTRNGYVAGPGLLWQELKGKSAGAFAKPAL